MPNVPEIQADPFAAAEWMARYNRSIAMPPDQRRALLVERFAAVGEGAVVRPPFHCDHGYNIVGNPARARS